MIIDFKVDCPISGIRNATNCLTCKYGTDFDGKCNMDVNCNAIEHFMQSSNFQGFLVRHMDMTVEAALHEFIEIDRYDP